MSDDSVCSRDSSCGLFERLHRNEGQCWMFIVFVHRNMVRVSTYSEKTFRRRMFLVRVCILGLSYCLKEYRVTTTCCRHLYKLPLYKLPLLERDTLM